MGWEGYSRQRRRQTGKEDERREGEGSKADGSLLRFGRGWRKKLPS
jgi:hypothetical protein